MMTQMSQMDTNMIYGLFAASIQPEEHSRKQAESHLKELVGSPGFGPSLLAIVMAPVNGADPVAGAIHQAASAHFKNFVEKHWETYDETIKCFINDQDKAAIRGVIVEAIVNAPDAVRKQLLTAIRRMIRSDFPKNWPSLLESVAGLLQSSEGANGTRRISAGLGIVQEIVAWRGHNQQEVFDVIQGQVFPVLLQIGQHFLTQTTSGDDAYGIIKSVLKSYFSAIQFKFSPWLLSGDAFLAWFNFCVQVIQLPVPGSLISLTKGAASDTAFWKMKKWAFHIQNKIMMRYGNTKCNTYANPEAPDFAKAYMQDMGIPVVQLYLGQVQLMLEGKNPLTDRIICIMCDFFEAAIRHKRTWSVLEGQIVGLVEHFVFPQLCWSEADQEMWEEDPHEFIRTKLDPFDDFYSASAACINFVVDLIKNRKKSTFMPILGFLNTVLGEAQAHPEDPQQQSRKDGAMYLVGSLSSILMESKVSGQMEAFLATFVLPELTSRVPHLRLRACWVVEQFDSLEYGEQANAMAALSGILACLGDQEFPVRVAAASGLGGILEDAFVKAALPPYLPKVIETILALANEIELDSLSYVLEDLVGAFSEEMAPYAAQLCIQLRDTLMRSLETYGANGAAAALDADDDGPSGGFFDDTDKMMAVIGMLGTINSLLDSMAGKAETMAQMEAILLPLIYTILQGKIMDVYEEVFSLLDSITFAQKAISEDLWALLENALYPVFMEAGSSYIPDMASTIDNYISYGTQSLLGARRDSSLRIIVEMIRITMTDDDYVESDWVHGCQLMESLMLNCRGAIDEFVPGFIQLVIAKLKPTAEDAQGGVHAISHCVLHVEAILNALYYNPMLALTELERLGATSMILTRWLDVASKFSRVHDKRLVIMAISSLLSTLPVTQMPASLQSQWPQLLGLYLDAIQTLPKAIEERRKLKEAEERSDDDDEAGHGNAFSDEEDFAAGDDDDHHDGHYPKDGYDGGFEEEDFDDDDEDDWEEDELEEELYFETPLDNLDVQAVVKGTLQSFAASQASLLSETSKALSPDHQAVLSAILSSH